MGDYACVICGVSFPRTPEYFYRHRSTVDGLRTSCKQCFLDRKRDGYRKKNNVPPDAPVRTWRASHPVVNGSRKCLDCGEEFPLTSEFFYNHASSPSGFKPYCKQCCVARNYKFVTRVSHGERDELLASQGGVCAICGTDAPGDRGWHLDHDHSCCSSERRCGKCNRGVLCRQCNLAIGFLRDSPGVAMSAAAYLEKFSQADSEALSG
jgi:Recombination endonuclease VII